MKEVVNFISILLLPVLWFLADAFYDQGKKLISSYFSSAFILCVCVIVGFWNAVFLVLAWFLFDIIYNIVRKLNILYVGKTKWTDRLIRWLCDTNTFTRGHYTHVNFILKLFAAAGIFALFYNGKL